jgi:predicted metal-dependent phosphoesterase TrpH
MTRRRPARRPAAEPDRRVDLHLHTTRSDGELEPWALVEALARRGLHTLAITDHDVPPALPAGATAVGPRTLRLLHAAEVSALHDGVEQHILVYFPSGMPDDFAAFLRSRARARAERYERAREQIGLPGLPPAGPEAWAGEVALTRDHLARALVREGHAAHLGEAYKRWCGRTAGLVPPVDIGLPAVLDTARSAGGLPVWAHPNVDAAPALAPIFAGMGLLGLEVERPSLRGHERDALATLAAGLGLVATGGSDHHGFGQVPGRYRVRESAVGAFFARLG